MRSPVITPAAVTVDATSEGALPPVVPQPAKPVAAKELTQRASLTAVASLIDYAVKAAVTLFITPILLRGLGLALMGMWEVLYRLGGYMTATDGRPTEALRLVVAQKEATASLDEKQRWVGASLVVWLLMLPVILIVSIALVWYMAPAVTQATGQDVATVRMTALMLVFAVLLTSLGSIPESVLRGMNLGYKRMGLQAALNIIGGVLSVVVVWQGLGLVGLGATEVVRAVITGLVLLWLTRRFVKWYGAQKPLRSDVKGILKLSLWLTAGDVISKILLASDVIVLSAIVSPLIVPVYTWTGFAARTAIGIHIFLASAAIPGVGRLIGDGQLDRAARARHELMLLTWLFATVVCATILFWNHSFMTLWVGRDLYAGPWINLLIVATTVQTAFIRTDAFIIDAALRPQQRVLVSGASALLVLFLSILLTRPYGIVGLCIAILMGRTVQTIVFPMLARSAIAGTASQRAVTTPRARWQSVKMMLAALLLFTAATFAGDHILAHNWLEWIAGVAATTLLVAVLAMYLGLNKEGRKTVVNRVRAMIPARGVVP